MGEGWAWDLKLVPPPARDHRDAQLHLDCWPHSKDILICSDANCQGSWDDKCKSDPMGEELDNWIGDKGLTVLNNSRSRVSAIGILRWHIPMADKTAPDIAIVYQSKSHIFSWKTLDSFGSDHLTILISAPLIRFFLKPTRKRNFRTTDWKTFMSVCEESFNERWPEQSLEKDVHRFVKIKQVATKKSTPSCSGKVSKPWWSSKCRQVKRNFNRCQKELRQDRNNLILLHKYQDARRIWNETIKAEKRDSWRQFAAEITPWVNTSVIWNTLRGMDGRSQMALPGVAILECEKTLTSDSQKAEATARVCAKISRLKVPRDQEKTAYEAVSAHLKVRSLTWPFDEDFWEEHLEGALKKLK